MYHEPVLLHESMDALDIRPAGTYVDATFGGGGHARELLKRLNASGRLFGFDRDADAMNNTLPDKRFTLINHNFRYAKKFLRYHNALPVNGILADLGISSHQIDVAERGFSTRYDAPLDMRMSRHLEHTAADAVNTYPEDRLVRMFSEYGEIKNAKTLARRITEARMLEPVQTIDAFKKILAACAERGLENQYYAKVFQALRIEINEELESLKAFLLQCPSLLATGGRLVVISYHSLEDRLVKNFIAKGKFEGEVEKDIYGRTAGVPFRAVNRKPIVASEEEIKRNSRARSAKLRIAERN